MYVVEQKWQLFYMFEKKEPKTMNFSNCSQKTLYILLYQFLTILLFIEVQDKILLFFVLQFNAL